MLSLRNLSAATLTVFLALFLAACKNASEDATQAADAENSQGVTQKVEKRIARSVTIPSGTAISVRLVDTLSSERNHGGDSFQATLDEPILVNGWVAAPKGANVTGRIIAAQPSGHLKTPPELSITLASLEVGGKSYEVTTSSYSRRGESHTKRNAKWIGGMAGGGALLGALVGKGKGAAIGAGVGAGAGTATAYATGKKDIYIPSETRLRFVLNRPLTITRVG